MKFSNYIGNIWKGMAMGIAEVIPGVSGGTIAFITGIYETLINSIKSIDGTFFKLLKELEFKKIWSHINGPFLLSLLIGMLGGVIIGVFGVSYFLLAYPEVLWAFFFGLILASVYVVMSMLKNANWKLIIPFLLGCIIAFGIVSLNPRPGSSQMLYLFFCGTIAICALILPGISGSFILLLLGMYTLVIPTLKNFLENPGFDDLKIIVVFAMGCLVGLLSFARLLSWTFKNYYDPTLALLCGFMIGSLKKIWPWRNPVQLIEKDSSKVIDYSAEHTGLIHNENYEILKDVNVLPSEYIGDPNTILVIIALVLGLVSVILMQKKSNSNAKQI